MLDVLRRLEELEELDGLRAPAGHVEGELLEHANGPLAPSVAKRVRDVCTLARSARGDRIQAAGAEEVSDVRDDPRLARLDEPVVIEAGDVVVYDRGLLGQDLNERSQLAELLLVAETMQDREQLVHVVGRDHGVGTTLIAVGSTVSSWAALIVAPSRRAPSAGRTAFTALASPVRLSATRSTPTTPLVPWIAATTSLPATDWPNDRRSKANAVRSASVTARSTVAGSWAGSTKTFASTSNRK